MKTYATMQRSASTGSLTLAGLAKRIKTTGSPIPEYFAQGEKNKVIEKGGIGGTTENLFLMGGRSSLAGAVANTGQVNITGAPWFNAFYIRFPVGFKTLTIIMMTANDHLYGLVPKDRLWVKYPELMKVNQMSLQQIVDNVLVADRVLGKMLTEAVVLNEFNW